mgnify:CR=1 FL=1
MSPDPGRLLPALCPSVTLPSPTCIHRKGRRRGETGASHRNRNTEAVLPHKGQHGFRAQVHRTWPGRMAGQAGKNTPPCRPAWAGRSTQPHACANAAACMCQRSGMHVPTQRHACANAAACVIGGSRSASRAFRNTPPACGWAYCPCGTPAVRPRAGRRG